MWTADAAAHRVLFPCVYDQHSTDRYWIDIAHDRRPTFVGAVRTERDQSRVADSPISIGQFRPLTAAVLHPIPPRVQWRELCVWPFVGPIQTVPPALSLVLRPTIFGRSETARGRSGYVTYHVLIRFEQRPFGSALHSISADLI